MKRQRRARARGAVMVEYAFLLVAVGIPSVVGLLAGGAAMYKEYQSDKAQLLRPLP